MPLLAIVVLIIRCERLGYFTSFNTLIKGVNKAFPKFTVSIIRPKSIGIKPSID